MPPWRKRAANWLVRSAIRAVQSLRVSAYQWLATAQAEGRPVLLQPVQFAGAGAPSCPIPFPPRWSRAEARVIRPLDER